MKPRTTPAPIPENSAKHLQVEGTWFRLPRLRDSVTISCALRDTASIADVEQRAIEVMMLGGACIGMCWADPELELETINDADSLVEYGEAVMDELHDAGWSVASLRETYEKLVQAVTADMTIPAKEVAARVGFSSATRTS